MINILPLNDKIKVEAIFTECGFDYFSDFDYSVLRATTGSFLAALLAGIRPETRVRRMLSAMRMMDVKPASQGSRG